MAFRSTSVIRSLYVDLYTCTGFTSNRVSHTHNIEPVNEVGTMHSVKLHTKEHSIVLLYIPRYLVELPY